MKRSVHFKAALDDSWITVDTTSLHHIAKMNSTSCVIQGPDQDLAGTHQRLRDSMSGRAKSLVQVTDKTGNKNEYLLINSFLPY